MRHGVCIERNEYHVNTSYIYRFRLHIEYVLSFLFYVVFILQLNLPRLAREVAIRCTEIALLRGRFPIRNELTNKSL
jgi:hypothetical protein